MAGHHDAHLGRAIVHVQTQRDLQPSTAIGGWVTCGAQLRHAPDRTAPLAYLARPPTAQPVMPPVDRIPTNERLGDPRLHGRNQGPRAERPDRSPTAGVGRHADAIATRTTRTFVKVTLTRST